ncbi:MAG: energy transducer TonB [Porticoccus sp.]|nr:energy transducer TonB [Porticoccus sp.]
MAISIPKTNPEHEPDRFGFSLFLAIAVHALLIFGLGFKLHQQQQAAPTLEVTLAQHRSEKEPEEAEFLAQHNQQGSGNQSDKQALTTDQLSEINANQLKKTGIPLQQQFTHQPIVGDTPTLSTTSDSLSSTTNEPKPEDAEQNALVPLPQATSLEIASLKAKLDQKQQEYSKLARVLRLTSASTKSADHAAYLRYWIDRIEMVGNNNYPEEARQKSMYGDLRLAVTVLPNGAVDNVEILLSSGQRVLDQAAIRTVRLASPFAPFPTEIKQWDKLEIIRTWRFVPGNQLNTIN